MSGVESSNHAASPQRRARREAVGLLFLPDDMLLRVIEYLPLQGFGRLQCVCKGAHERKRTFHKAMLLRLWQFFPSERKRFETLFTVRGKRLTAHKERVLQKRLIMLYRWLRKCLTMSIRGSGRPSLRKLPSTLKKSRHFLFEVIRLGTPFSVGMVLSANPDLAYDRSFALDAVTIHPRGLRYLSSRLRDDDGIVLAAVSRNGASLEHASNRLRHCKRIVLSAIDNDGMALQFAGREFKESFPLAQRAMQSNPSSIGYASKELISELGWEKLCADRSSCAAASRSKQTLASKSYTTSGAADIEYLNEDHEFHPDFLVVSLFFCFRAADISSLTMINDIAYCVAD